MSKLSRRQFLALSTGASALLLCPSLSYADVRHKAKGRVLINGQLASSSTPIKSGDSIETGDKSELIFKLHKDAYKIKANTQVKIHSASADGSGLLEVIGGAMLAVFGKSNKRIKTPIATMGIRGTGVYIQVDEQESYFCTCFGETELEAGGKSQRVKANHHKAKTVKKNKQMVDAKMIGHDDWELEELADIAGIALPESFTNGDYSY